MKSNDRYYKTDIRGAPDGILQGLKVAIKDSFPVAGVPMMHGSRVIEGYVPDYDPTVVTRILDAGKKSIELYACSTLFFILLNIVISQGNYITF